MEKRVWETKVWENQKEIKIVNILIFIAHFSLQRDPTHINLFQGTPVIFKEYDWINIHLNSTSDSSPL